MQENKPAIYKRASLRPASDIRRNKNDASQNNIRTGAINDLSVFVAQGKFRFRDCGSRILADYCFSRSPFPAASAIPGCLPASFASFGQNRKADDAEG
jgi:hypothetical protein